MKLIKINTDHYVVVDENAEIKEGDWFLPISGIGWELNKPRQADSSGGYSNGHCTKITHSTQPLECDKMWTPVNGKQWMCNTMLCCGKILNPKTKPISLQEVKELIGEVDVEKKAEYNWMLHTEGSIVVTDKNDWKSGFHHGYTQAIEDNKDKKYTEENMKFMFEAGYRKNNLIKSTFEGAIKFIQSLQPKTEWEVEIIDEKLKLKQ